MKNFFILLSTIFLLFGCEKSEKIPDDLRQKNIDEKREEQKDFKKINKIGIANPASENCEKKGGNLKIKKDPNGGEYGVCVFEDNKQCEEWTLFNNKCVAEKGVKITEYETEGQIYCAITGGTVDMKKNICTRSDKTKCDIDKNFAGNCEKEKKLLGGDRDEYGCIGSAGYSWCEKKKKCLRPWEEKCE